MFKRKLLSCVSGFMILAMVAGSALPVLTAFAVTNTRSEDLIFQKDSTGNVVAILSKNGLITPIGDVLVIYNASGVATGIKTIYGEVIAISGTGTTYTLPVATSSVLGGIKPDGTTLTVNASGVASATASGASAAGTLTGTTLASNVTASSLLSAGGGTFGSAAYRAITDFLAVGSNAVSASTVPITGVTGLGTGVAAAAASAVNTAGGLVARGTTAPTYTANHTFVAADLNTLSPINIASSGATTHTLAEDVGFSTAPIEGDTICIKQAGAGKPTIAASGVLIDSASGYMAIGAQSGVACLQRCAPAADCTWNFVGSRGN